MIESLACVKECKINKGSGLLDFLSELEEIQPSVFVVNEDGNTPSKIDLCKTKNIELIVLDRLPSEGLPGLVKGKGMRKGKNGGSGLLRLPEPRAATHVGQASGLRVTELGGQLR